MAVSSQDQPADEAVPMEENSQGLQDHRPVHPEAPEPREVNSQGLLEDGAAPREVSSRGQPDHHCPTQAYREA